MVILDVLSSRWLYWCIRPVRLTHKEAELRPSTFLCELIPERSRTFQLLLAAAHSELTLTSPLSATFSSISLNSTAKTTYY